MSRKVRNLKNGKMYKHKCNMRASKFKSLIMKEQRKRGDLSACCIIATHFHKNPHIRKRRTEKISKKAKELYPYSIFSASIAPVVHPEVAKTRAYELTHCKDGVEVVRFLECDRDNSVGVVQDVEEED